MGGRRSAIAIVVPPVAAAGDPAPGWEHAVLGGCAVPHRAVGAAHIAGPDAFADSPRSFFLITRQPKDGSMPTRKKGLVPATVRATIDGTGRRFGTADIVTLAVFYVPDVHPKVPGSWAGEADKIAWIDPATGMNCIIHRSIHGHLCGYVAVEAGHPFYGFDADALPRDPALKVHGRVAYAQACEHLRPISRSIWRSPPTADAPPAWWFGFACNHSFDVVPGMTARGAGARAGWTTRSFGELRSDPSCFNRGCDCPPRRPVRTLGYDAGRDHAGRLPAYREEAYVYRECVYLAAQLDAVARGLPMPERTSIPSLGIALPLLGDDR